MELKSIKIGTVTMPLGKQCQWLLGTVRSYLIVRAGCLFMYRFPGDTSRDMQLQSNYKLWLPLLIPPSHVWPSSFPAFLSNCAFTVWVSVLSSVASFPSVLHGCTVALVLSTHPHSSALATHLVHRKADANFWVTTPVTRRYSSGRTGFQKPEQIWVCSSGRQATNGLDDLKKKLEPKSDIP